MFSDSASLYSTSSQTPLVGKDTKKSRSLFRRILNKIDEATAPTSSPQDMFDEIMAINASSGDPHVKAYMAHRTSALASSEMPTSTTKKTKKVRSQPTGQEIADEIMRINATSGHPSIQAYSAYMTMR
ncbi:hypothetical protein BMF94_1150 [Rhodotorula taiwanensis]|uniref:Uncharacterized protein n=1 Tax=Rhodotorula taiwanensis TaxID=741276 RepID=A0A2S5BG52_9BASI|nr:hypothetical protein BMF94_1150 [Rhodotorula taiwanensis]